MRYTLPAVARSLALAVVIGCRSDTSISSPTESGPAVSSISIFGPAIVELPAHGNWTLHASALDGQGINVPSAKILWSSDNPLVAAVEPDGLVTGQNQGITVVRAHVGQVSASVTVTVDKTLAVTVFPQGEFGDTIQLAPGQALQLTAFEYDHYLGVPVHGTGVPQWMSTHGDVATVNSSGLVTAVAAGDAQIGLVLDSMTTSRVIHVAPTIGSASVQLVNADPNGGTLVFRSNNGSPAVSLGYGETHEETIAAGTLFVSVDGYQLASPPWCDCYDGGQPIQEFLGFMRPGSKVTLVATSGYWGFALAPMWGWNGAPIAADSAMVRVLVNTTTGYNVYFADVGGPMSVLSLRGCYLDWPYGASDFASRAAKPFDIILQGGKFSVDGPVAARLTVTPQPGVATTYILTGDQLKMITIVDPKN